ncbi:diadenosine tetraphosphate (Ap4A) HIT family hydrolase [Paenibacillus taihuensis]|uniref:Diadenosine tetraphosphate (Ap4A) HIT family hydrolase n=1 Tax=Paenibacillus taihuensis TaxID=1156355 RepID=A0A3D9R1L3_9BACL|nr:HIT family protein [Paenibacillus taihuensis]REE68716.1 diadenosine tetraphosphate (Ap4A) HIT family hydrolase [Paenibacillus taihuensis]
MDIHPCFICSKHSGEVPTIGGVIYENEHVSVSHVGIGGSECQNEYLGYLIIEAKRHARGLGDLTDEEASAIFIAANRMSRVLREALQAEHVYSYVRGDGVPHFHMHLIPRYDGTPEQFWHPVQLAQWPDAPRGNAEQIERICEQLRAAIGS